MARKPGTNGRSSTPMATTLIIPGKKVLDGLIETLKRAASAIGVYRQKVGDAVEKDHLDKWAYGVASKMAEMEDDVLHVRYFHLMHYLEEMGVVKRATAQEEMFAGGETGPSPKANGHADGDDKATRIGAAARDVVEKAGARLPGD